MSQELENKICHLCEGLSSDFDYSSKEISIILAAGHGKRIKSQKSKMLHEIWGVPSVLRVYKSAVAGIPNSNTVLVVGIKATDVVAVVGKREKNKYAYQMVQKGTGHAVQVGIEKVDKKDFDGTVYVLPGDMGLLDADTIAEFRAKYIESESDMMVLTGIYQGPIENNNYGRIIRVKENDINGNSSFNDFGNVIEIIEHKDILAIEENQPYIVTYNQKQYSFTKEELLNIREYNSGVYAFNYAKLVSQLFQIKSDNAQNEIYITDMIALFNSQGYKVLATSPKDEYVLMGFNDKAVLKEMERVFRHKVYERLKNIIYIEDTEDFFIDESVVNDIIESDRQGKPLDIHIGKGVFIGEGVKLNYNLTLKKNVFVSGNVIFGENVSVWENVHLSCYPNQNFIIGDNVEIFSGDIIKGNIIIGDNSRIESSVNMTGSDDFPLRIGSNVLVKGTSYIFGSIIEDDIQIEHSVIINKKVNRLVKKDGEIQRIRFFLPMPSGIDAIDNLD